MIKGKVEAVKTEAFTSKAGAELFKVAIKVNDTWFNTISKFDNSVKKGTEVVFEVKEDRPTDIVIGTLKKTTTGAADVLLQRIAELELRVTALEKR